MLLIATSNPTVATATWSVANTVSLQNDTAHTFLYDLDVGTHAITAVYAGDNNNLGSTSEAVTQVRGPTLLVRDAWQRRVAVQVILHT